MKWNAERHGMPEEVKRRQVNVLKPNAGHRGTWTRKIAAVPAGGSKRKDLFGRREEAIVARDPSDPIFDETRTCRAS